MPLNEADTKIKILIYLSLGQAAKKIFHQRNPQTEMSKCTTDAFVEQLKETSKEVRKETFDRLIPLENKTNSCPMQLGRIRRQPGKEYIHTRNAKFTNTKGIIIRRPRPVGDTPVRISKKKGAEKSAKIINPNRNKPNRVKNVQYLKQNNIQ